MHQNAHGRRPCGKQGARATVILVGALLASVLAAPLSTVLDLLPAGAVSPGLTSVAAVGRVPKVPAGATAVAPLGGATTIQALVGIRPRDPAALAAFDAEVSDPGSPDYGHYLAKGQFAGRFGPTTQTLDAVESALRDLGVAVGTPTPDRLAVPVSGIARKVASALHTTFEQYRLPSGRLAYANTSAPELPEAIVGDVTGIVGLNTLVKRTPALTLPSAPLHPSAGGAGRSGESARGATPSVLPRITGETGSTACKTAKTNEWVTADGAYPWTTLATAYDFAKAYGAKDVGSGETVGLFELATYTTTDITGFKSCFTLPSGETYGTLTKVSVDGGNATPTTEATLDIDTILGLAPEANVDVYEAPNSTVGADEEYEQIVTTDKANVVSSSWGACEETYSTATVANIENATFEEATAQGQTFLAASGDTGSADCYRTSKTKTTKLDVDTPASQPYVTGVGGTDLETVGNGSTKAPTEKVWNEKSSKLGSGGGGVSKWWAKPAWQTVTATANPTGSCKKSPSTSTTTTACRQVPDVSASADPDHGDLVYCKGLKATDSYCTSSATKDWADIGGTSAASPTWAALVALADQACGTPLGFVNPKLYQMGADGQEGFHDITTGTNNYVGGHTGDYDAGVGFDNASGWGSPNGATFFADACETPVTSPSVTLSSATAGATGVKYTVSFTTTSTGALSTGEQITLVAPAGPTLPTAAADYAVTSPRGVSIPSVHRESVDGGKTNAVVVTIAGSVGASASVTLTVSGVTNETVAGSEYLTIETTANQAPARAVFTIKGGTPAAATTTVVASTTTPTAGSPVTLTVTEKDKYGNLVTGDTVALTASTGSSAVYTPAQKATTTGVAVFKVTDDTAQKVTFTAKNTTPAVTFTAKPSVTWKAGTVSATKSTVVASASTAVAGNSVTLTVTEKDSYGNTVPVGNVALAESAGSHGTFTPAQEPTTTGVAVFTVTDHTAETVLFTARSTTPSVTFTATPSVTWDGPVSTDPPLHLTGVSCPGPSTCFAVDATGQVVRETHGTWKTPVEVDGTRNLTSISCTSLTFCEAVDATGDALGWDGTTWSSAHAIDAGHDLSTVSCTLRQPNRLPTPHQLCAAGDATGNVLILTTLQWTGAKPADPGNSITASVCFSFTIAYFHLTLSLCLWFDNHGNVIYPTTAKATDWASRAVDAGHDITSVSCSPEPSVCMGVDNSGNAIELTTPTAEPTKIDGTNDLVRVSCPAQNACTATDSKGNVIDWNGTSWSVPRVP